ncbi:Histone H4 [Cercospora zeina]
MARFRESNASMHFRSHLPNAAGRIPLTPAASSSGNMDRRTPAASASASASASSSGRTFNDRTSAFASGRRSESYQRPGLGLAGKGLKRHRKIKILRDNILGITNGSLRRLARRGGVKRMSPTIYDATRLVVRTRLELLLRDICAVVEHGGRKTVCTSDVVFVLNRVGATLYGFGLGEKGGGGLGGL